MDPTSGRELSRRWIRACRGLDPPLRVPFLRDEFGRRSVEEVAPALERLCFDAEQAEPEAREVLIALTDLLVLPGGEPVATALRAEASRRAFHSLSRLLPKPSAANLGARAVGPAGEGKVPDYGRGRLLTLGERKALARQPSRKSLEKLLADPHPAVVRTVLANPKVVEADVLGLASRRPNRPELLAEVLRSPRWSHRPRVRLAVVLNPDAPLFLTVPLVALLVRTELQEVMRSHHLDPSLRLAARDRLERRPPSTVEPQTDELH